MKPIITLLLLLAVSTSVFAEKKDKKVEVERPGTESFNYQRAIEALQAKNLDEAISYFSKELQENKKNGYAYAMRGDAEYKKEDNGNALMDFNQALKYLPSKDKEFVGNTLCARGNVYFAMGDSVRGLDDFSKAIELEPEKTDMLERRGQIYYEQSKYDLADKDYQAIMNLNDGHYMAYMGLGRDCYERKEYDKAIEYYNKVIALYKEYDSGYSFRADAYLQKKEWVKAADDIISSLAIGQDSKAYYLMLSDEKGFYPVMLAKLKVKIRQENTKTEWYYDLGSLYEHNKKYNLAIEAYRKCNEMEQQPQFLERISDCYSELGEMDNALEYINQAQELDSTETNYISSKADILYYQNKVKEAIAELDRYVELTPDYSGGYYRRGFYKDNAEMVDDAIEDYTMAISLDPTFAYAYFSRGDQYMKKGEKELAEADYKKVVEIDTVPSLQPLRAYAFLALGKKDEGKVFLDSCLVKYPEDAGLRYDAACFSARSGDSKAALDYLEQSFKLGYIKFAHLEMDDDMNSLRNLPEYKALIDKYKKQLKYATDSKPSAQTFHEEVKEVPFTRDYGNTCTVKCTINELPLSFIFDTGASDVSISQVEATFMMKNGYLSKSDVIGKQYFSDANGNINEGTEINLKKVNFGGMELSNVRASVVKNQRAPLLLGQSVFQRLGKIEIDNDKKILKITRRVK